jgi:hypothetical protein
MVSREGLFAIDFASGEVTALQSSQSQYFLRT